MSGRKEEVTDKLTEPFEFFAFVEKPFDREQLVEAIREAMMKSKKQPQVLDNENGGGSVGVDNSAMETEIEALKTKVAKMEQEMEQMKKQISQLVNYIRQKLK